MINLFKRDREKKHEKKLNELMKEKEKLFIQLEYQRDLYRQKKKELQKTKDPFKRKLIESELDEIAKDIESIAVRIEEITKAIKVLNEERRRDETGKTVSEVTKLLEKSEEKMLEEAKEIVEEREKSKLKAKVAEKTHEIITSDSKFAKAALQSIEEEPEEYEEEETGVLFE